MKEIEDFKLSEFMMQDAELINDYMTVLRYVNQAATKKELFHMKLREVEDVKQKIQSGNDADLISIIALIEGMEKNEVLNTPIIRFFALVNSVKKQVEQIAEAEENSLVSSIVNPHWEMVEGGRRMAKFGIYNTLESLAGGDVLKYEAIMNLEYAEVFTVLHMRKVAAEIQHDMNNIKTK